MIGIAAESTAETVASTVGGLAELGFTAICVFARGIPEPERVVDVIAGAMERTN